MVTFMDYLTPRQVEALRQDPVYRRLEQMLTPCPPGELVPFTASVGSDRYDPETERWTFSDGGPCYPDVGRRCLYTNAPDVDG